MIHALKSNPYEPPTEADLKEADGSSGQNTLMQMQVIEFAGNVNRGLVFWDPGSNMNIVRRKFAEMLGVEGRPVVQFVQVRILNLGKLMCIGFR